ncbi:hypothetical protein YC2023_098847 [Brassica napus]
MLCEVLAFRDFFRVYLRMFRIAIGALLRVFLTCRIVRVKHSRLIVNRSIWKLAVLSFIAKDVVAKGLDHDTFVLSIRSSRLESSLKGML